MSSDRKKINILNERVIHDKYPYVTIVIAIYNIEDLRILINSMREQFGINLQHNFNSISRYINTDRPVYVRFYKSYGDKLDYFYGALELLDSNVQRQEYEKLFNIGDVTSGLVKSLIERGIRLPDYKTRTEKGVNNRSIDWTLTERLKFNIKYPYDSIIILLNNRNDNDLFIDYFSSISIDSIDNYYQFSERLKNLLKYLKSPIIDRSPVYICFYLAKENFLTLEWDISSRLLDYQPRETFERLFTVNDIKTNFFKNIIVHGQSLSVVDMYNKRKDNLTNRILEKSSLSILGVPSEVMKPIQRDLSIPDNAEWRKIGLKRDALSLIQKKDKLLFLQIEIDSITVFISYGGLYYTDVYIIQDNIDWGGGYKKLPRETISKSHFISRLDTNVLLYYLKDDFSINTQPYRKMKKRTDEFENFTLNFKIDFLEQFNSILKRMVGYNNYDEAKEKIIDNARKIEKENKMIVHGLDNPLETDNSLTILDEFLIKFEKEYSKFFGERLDILELSELFTRDKIMSSFMLFVYSGKIITT